MSDKAEKTSNSLDMVKWPLVIAIIVALVYGYETYTDISILYRAIGALVLAVIALGIAATTHKGSTFLTFAKEARIEVRKVVWPERQEAVRLTLVIIAATAIVGVVLYLFDMLIVWAVGLITGIGA
ncbi:preprotein translocase subunit SecE [Glaciecola sp. 1036]|uniref:preprotein translocase subunit SecE n=1 Tax=Alteromonadaceae TaxID=72275 RepID=UPI003CFE6941